MEQYQEAIIQSLLENVLNKAAHGIKKTASNTWEKFKTDYKLVFKEYLKNAYDKYSKVKTMIYRTQPWPLIGPDGFFVNPYFAPASDYAYRKTGSCLLEGISTIISYTHHHVVIQADGGMGKSTLMKYLFLSTLDDNVYIPIFVELRELNVIDDDYDLTEFFFDKLYSLGSTLDPKYMEHTLSNNLYIFLLDGYDEIHTLKRNIFQRKFDKFVDMYPDNIYIVSSRPIGNFWEFQRFTVYSLLPFGFKQAISQIEKLKYDEKIKANFITALKNGLYEKHKDFASNPLLLNIMLLTYEDYGDIPKKLHNFYSAAFDTMLHRHDATKGVFQRELKCRLSDDHYKNTFAQFCFMTYCRGEMEFSRNEIKRLLNYIDDSIQVDDFIYDMQNALCVFFQTGTNYVYSHRSFQEYFTAVFLEKQNDVLMEKYGTGIIKKTPGSLKTDNVFPMLSDMNRSRFDKNILIPIVEYIKGDSEKDLFDALFRKLCTIMYFVLDKSNKEEWHLELLLTDKTPLPTQILYALLSPECCCFWNSNQNDFPSRTEDLEPLMEMSNLSYKSLAGINLGTGEELCESFKYEPILACSSGIDCFKKTYYGKKLTCIVNYIEEAKIKTSETENTMDSYLGFDQ